MNDKTAVMQCIIPSRTGGSSIKKIYKGHSPEPPTLVVKCKETLSRDVTWLRSDAFKKISCWAGLFKMQRFEIFRSDPFINICQPWTTRRHAAAREGDEPGSQCGTAPLTASSPIRRRVRRQGLCVLAVRTRCAMLTLRQHTHLWGFLEAHKTAMVRSVLTPEIQPFESLHF
jgi:hypothetical protein